LAEKRLKILPQTTREQVAGHIARVWAYAAWMHHSQNQAVKLAEQAAVLLLSTETAVPAFNLTMLGSSMNPCASSQRSVAAHEQSGDWPGKCINRMFSCFILRVVGLRHLSATIIPAALARIS
jgi:hypothetical protein